MSGTRRPSIRPVSRQTKKASNTLQECRCFEELDRRLRMGWSTTDLVKFVQEEQQELVNLSPSYVRKMIDDFRRTIPPAELLISTQSTVVATNAARRLSNGMQELEELNRLYELQMERINIDVANEKKINKLFQTTGREIFYAMKILKQSADLKMDLGIAKRQLGEVSVSGQAGAQIAQRYNNDQIGNVMTNNDSRRKVLGMVEMLMGLSAKVSVDAAEFVKSAAEFNGDDVIDAESVESSGSDDAGADSDGDVQHVDDGE